MSDEPLRRALADLVHDVGKPIARTARNVEASAVSPAVLGMLVRDLYAIDGSRRASDVFAERARPMEGMLSSELREARAALASIDALEDGVRAGEGEAIARALGLALRVERLVRALASRSLGRPG